MLVVVFVVGGWAPAPALLTLLAGPLAVPITKAIRRTTEGPPLIVALKGIARLDLIFGLLLALGVAL